MNKLPVDVATSPRGQAFERARLQNIVAQVMHEAEYQRLPPLVRPAILARMFDMARQRIYEMVEMGELDAIRTGPRGMRITRASVQRWLASRNVR